MRQYDLKDFFGGWFIGDFDPAVFRTKHFEVGVKVHHKGEYWAPHKHNKVREINVLLHGVMWVNGEKIVSGQIFEFEPGEPCTPEFLEYCELVVIKVPSVPGDKVLL